MSADALSRLSAPDRAELPAELVEAERVGTPGVPELPRRSNVHDSRTPDSVHFQIVKTVMCIFHIIVHFPMNADA